MADLICQSEGGERSVCVCVLSPQGSLELLAYRLCLKLSAPRVNLKTAGERSFRFQAPRVWNSLPVEICQSPSLSSFKYNLRTYLFIQAFESSSPSCPMFLGLLLCAYVEVGEGLGGGGNLF